MRARNIKPGFFTDIKIGKLNDSEKMLFIGLWCLADKEGFFEIIPEQIIIQIWPYKKIKESGFKKMLSNLISRNLIVSNGKYGWIPKFLEHQHPHPDEAKSKISCAIKESLKTLINQSNGISLNLMKSQADLGLRNDELGIINKDLGLRNDESCTANTQEENPPFPQGHVSKSKPLEESETQKQKLERQKAELKNRGLLI